MLARPWAYPARVERYQVATFNIHHGAGLDGSVDLERIAEVIRASRAELVALQELDRGLPRSGNKDQPAVLAEMLGMPVHFFLNLEREGGEYGIGVMCSDATIHGATELPRSARSHPRAAITASWRGFSIVATHLSPDRASRRSQIPTLAALTEELPPPVLVLGDLNCGRIGLRPLLARGFRPAPGWRRTTDRGMPRQIDHVLAGPGARVLSAYTLGGGTSDHRLVAASVAVDPSRPRPAAD